MTTQRYEFTHDGHRFTVEEESSSGRADAHAPDAHVTWCVRMDGESVLEFRGDFPYREDDLRKRVLEWYELQKAR